MLSVKRSLNDPSLNVTGSLTSTFKESNPIIPGSRHSPLKMGVAEEGDPNNLLLEITFDRGPGHDIHARRYAIIASAFGFETAFVPTLDDETISAVRGQIEAKLPALRALFNGELLPGEFLQVKAPFFGPDGAREWMWVEVVTWSGDTITGILINDPLYIPHLHVGQPVKVLESTIIDYLHQRSDGTIEGGNSRLN